MFRLSTPCSAILLAGTTLIPIGIAPAVNALPLCTPQGSEPDWVIEGDRADDRFGESVALAGDVNVDGHVDVLVGAPLFDDGSTNEGAAFLYFGSPSGPALEPDWTGRGQSGVDRFGWSVAGAGDVNGDGYDEVLVGAQQFDAGEVNEGRAFLFHGSVGGPSLSADWTAEGELIEARCGWSVSGAGDVNGDGYADVLVGTPGFNHEFSIAGRAFLYLGSDGGASPWPALKIDGIQPIEGLGTSLAGGGDVDGDGHDDILIGSPNFSNGQHEEGRVSPFLGPLPDCNGNGVVDAQDIARAASEDLDGNGVPDECESAGLAYCSGDGSGRPCPCANAGAAGHGCANGSFASGAALEGLGEAGLAFGDLTLVVSSSAPNHPGLFFQGDDALGGGSGIPFGDGLRCAGTNVVRLEVAAADGAGDAATTVAISAVGGVLAGDLKRYQWWYRDPALSPCGEDFNLSNGLEVAWLP